MSNEELTYTEDFIRESDGNYTLVINDEAESIHKLSEGRYSGWWHFSMDGQSMSESIRILRKAKEYSINMLLVPLYE